MRYYFAPMEGITGYVFRNAHQACFSGADRYYTPFLAPGGSHKLSTREKNDILPEHNQKMNVIPQILTNQAEDFIWLCRELAGYGYGEVNLNLGCPSGTVAAKGKGAGFLGDRESLDRFLDQVFSGLSVSEPQLQISVKTRIGMEAEEEFPGLLEIYNRYPLCELTVHPRIRTDYYHGHPRMHAFRLAAEKSRNPVCYNGDICSREDVESLKREFPELLSVMIGRGAVASPWLMERLCGFGTEKTEEEEKKRFWDFHELLLDGYREIMSGDRNVLFKMKELWFYFGCHFPDSKKELKQIKKAQRIVDYRSAVRALFESGRFQEAISFRGE